MLATGLQDAALTGLALSAFAAGNLVGSVSYSRLPLRRVRPEVMVWAGLLIMAVPFAVLPLAGGRWPTPALFALAGLVNGPTFASLLVVRDREAPPAVRTQVFTIGAGLKVTAAAAGAAVAGLVTGWGSAPLLLAGGLGVALLLRRGPAPRAWPAHP